MADRGMVYLVGAGPGDPGLITIRGRDALTRADVVVFDFLANPVLLDHCRKDCERIYVGKEAGSHTMKQEEISRLIVDLARKGKTVVRLKGGDPYIFGRGGEEALELAKSGIGFEVVPGITSGIAAPAYAGIPLTQRGIAASVAFVTGHEDPEKEGSDVNWEEAGRSKTTLVFYMGVRNIGRIVKNLIDHGRDASTPAALVRWGTLPVQQTVEGTLEDIEEQTLRAGIKAPAVLVVGAVVRLRNELRWFDNQKLFGRRILVTRSRSQVSSLAAALRSLGADVAELPTIAIKQLDNYAPLDDKLMRLNDYAWVVFTSLNTVESVFERLAMIGKDARAFAGSSVAVVGTETARALSLHGITPDLVPVRQTSIGLAQSYKAKNIALAGCSVLYPCSDIAPKTLIDDLTDLGADVARVVAYQTICPCYTREEIEKAISPMPDLITFTSSSTVTHLLKLLDGFDCARALDGTPAACIGPVTAETAANGHFNVAVEANPHTVEALVQGIEEYLSNEEKKT